MNEYTVIGYRPYEFEGKDGSEVNGISLYCIAEGDEHVTGRIAERMSLPKDRLSKMNWNPAVGDIFIPFYNKYGKVEAVQLQSSSKK